MSTNNNHWSRNEKEIKPIFKHQGGDGPSFAHLDSVKLQSLVSNKLSDCNAVTLSNRGMTKIVDMDLFSSKLRRLDLSKNKLTRLACFSGLKGLSMLNVSENDLQGDSSLDELRYLVELRTLNISSNPKVSSLRSHVAKSFGKLQALIASGCGLSKVGFLQYCQELNTLILSKNHIESWQPSIVGQLPNLQKISLGFNGLKSIPDFSRCGALAEIRLNGNKIDTIDDNFLRYAAGRIKTLDLSNNQLTEWHAVENLTRLTQLTNLGIQGNPLPAPPVSSFALNQTLKEDVALEKGRLDGEDEAKRHFRQYVLVLFQKEVGKSKKVLEQLIVLDQKRVKVKWTQGGAVKDKGMKKDKMKGVKNDKMKGRDGDEGEWEIMSEGADQEKSQDEDGRSRKKNKRGKKPALSSLGKAVAQADIDVPVHAHTMQPVGKSVLSNAEAGKHSMPSVTPAAPSGAARSSSEAESGVLQVEVLKRAREAAQGENEGARGRKKKKKKKDKMEGCSDSSSHDKESAEQMLAALSSQSRVVSIGTGGASSW
jgi:hypothetical protein